MRIRSTKPEFWRSERIASVDWDARLVLKGLESYVDDNGVGKDDIALIVGDVFPRDMLASPRETYARVSEAITHLHHAGLLWRYEVDGTRLLYVSFWEEIQRIDRPGKGRFPRPDGTMDYKASIIRESVASPREGVATGTGEQGNRGTGEVPTAVQTEQHSGETQLDARAATPAADLVRKHIPRDIPAATQTGLRLATGELLKTGTPEDVVADALDEWLTRTGIGPSVLHSIAADIVKRRNGHATAATNGHRIAASDAAYAAAQALKTKPATGLELE